MDNPRIYYTNGKHKIYVHNKIIEKPEAINLRQYNACLFTSKACSFILAYSSIRTLLFHAFHILSRYKTVYLICDREVIYKCACTRYYIADSLRRMLLGEKSIDAETFYKLIGGRNINKNDSIHGNKTEIIRRLVGIESFRSLISYEKNKKEYWLTTFVKKEANNDWLWFGEAEERCSGAIFRAVYGLIDNNKFCFFLDRLPKEEIDNFISEILALSI